MHRKPWKEAIKATKSSGQLTVKYAFTTTFFSLNHIVYALFVIFVNQSLCNRDCSCGFESLQLQQSIQIENIVFDNNDQ